MNKLFKKPRVLLLTKRYYMSKDIIADQYGRFFELPKGLNVLGFDVTLVTLNYRMGRDEKGVLQGEDYAINYYSFVLNLMPGKSLFSCIKKLSKIIEGFAPDVIICCSDAFNIILGSWFARKIGVPCVADLYDNFEAYGATQIPFVKSLFKSSLQTVSAITCISYPLKKYLIENYSIDRDKIEVVENAVNPKLFVACKKSYARTKLGLKLPNDAKLIGTAGALDNSRDINTLFRAFEILLIDKPELYLLLAGPLGKGTSLPKLKNVFYLGCLAHSRVPLVIGALDVAVVCNTRSKFGDYCYPQKLCEIVRMGVPVVVARTLSTEHCLTGYENNLYESGDVTTAITALDFQLEKKICPQIAVKDWSEIAGIFAGVINRLLG